MNAKKLIRSLPALLVLVPIFFLMTGCSKKKVQPEDPGRPVKVATAVQKDAPVYVDAFGNLESPNSVDIKSQVTGKIERVHFKEGDAVKRGDLLFSIEKSEYEADLRQAEAQLAADRADLHLKEAILKRNTGLVASKLISQQDFEQYQTDVEAARAKIEVDQAGIDLAKINLGYCSITSPIDGVTGKRQVDPGNIVAADSGPTLVNVKEVDPLYMDFSISERFMPEVRREMTQGTLKVYISPQGDKEGPYEGGLQFIDNAVDETTGTIALRAAVDNKERKLWPGQFAKVRLIVATAKNVIEVSDEAVQLGQKGEYLYVVTDDNKADLRDEIVVGQHDGDNVVIEKGVKAGEKVVTYGQMGLSPGAKVKIVTGEEKKEMTKSLPAGRQGSVGSD